MSEETFVFSSILLNTFISGSVYSFAPIFGFDVNDEDMIDKLDGQNVFKKKAVKYYISKDRTIGMESARQMKLSILDAESNVLFS